MSDVTVLGSGFAGANAALLAAANGLDVEVLDKNGYHCFKPGLIDLYRDRVAEEKNIRNLNELYEGTGVEFSREVVEEIDPKEKKIRTNAGEKEYSTLVIALGSEPRELEGSVRDVENPYTLEGVRRTEEKLDDVEEIALVGGSYIGVEVGSELAEMGKDVTIFDYSTRPLSTFSKKASQKVLDYFNKKNIKFRGAQKVERLEEKTVETDDGERFEYDMVMSTTGVQTPEIVRRDLGADKSGLDVNSKMESENFDDIYAVGDSADDDAIKTAHNAVLQAKTVAANVAGYSSEFHDSDYPLVVSLGDKAIVEFKSISWLSGPLRGLKDIIRKYYWATLKINRRKATLTQKL